VSTVVVGKFAAGCPSSWTKLAGLPFSKFSLFMLNAFFEVRSAGLSKAAAAESNRRFASTDTPTRGLQQF
jgi:hypothetical protein